MPIVVVVVVPVVVLPIPVATVPTGVSSLVAIVLRIGAIGTLELLVVKHQVEGELLPQPVHHGQCLTTFMVHQADGGVTDDIVEFVQVLELQLKVYLNFCAFLFIFLYFPISKNGNLVGNSFVYSQFPTRSASFCVLIFLFVANSMEWIG